MDRITREFYASHVPERIARGVPRAILHAVNESLQFMGMFSDPGTLGLIQTNYTMPTIAALRITESAGTMIGVLASLLECKQYELCDYIVQTLLPKVKNFVVVFARRPVSQFTLDESTGFAVMMAQRLHYELEMQKRLLAADGWGGDENAVSLDDRTDLSNPGHHDHHHHSHWGQDMERNPTRACLRCGLRLPSFPKQ